MSTKRNDKQAPERGLFLVYRAASESCKQSDESARIARMSGFLRPCCYDEGDFIYESSLPWRKNDFVSPYPLDEYGLPIFKPLPEASVIEFKELLEQEYGLTLTMDEATDVTNRLVQARYLLDIHLVVKQLLKEQEEQKLKGLPFNPMPKRAPRRKPQT